MVKLRQPSQGLRGTSKMRTVRRSRQDLVFDVCNTALMLLFLFIMFYPLWFVLIASLSDIHEVGLGNVFLLPHRLTLDAYRNVIINDSIWTGYRNTIFYTAGGTLYGLVTMLPQPDLMDIKSLFGRSAVTWFFLITMYFSGGIVPSYILIKNLRLLNTPWVMIVGAVNVYNMIVTRTYFQCSIPGDIYEAAAIDGTNELIIFFWIALPLATPIIAVMALYYAVAIWNQYFSALMYVTKPTLYPLQLVLRNILIFNQTMITDPEYFASLSQDEQLLLVQKAHLAESMKYSVIYIASAPLLVAYPFVQKYFVKGIMIGSLKG